MDLVAKRTRLVKSALLSVYNLAFLHKLTEIQIYAGTSGHLHKL